MTPWELILAGLLYVSVAIRYWHNEDPAMALAFISYALANVGFVWKALTT